MTEREITVSGHRNRCPYCHDTLGGETFTCQACQTTHHRKCWDEQGGCTVLGCAGTIDDRSVPATKTGEGIVGTSVKIGEVVVSEEAYDFGRPMISPRSTGLPVRPTPLKEGEPASRYLAPRRVMRPGQKFLRISLPSLGAISIIYFAFRDQAILSTIVLVAMWLICSSVWLRLFDDDCRSGSE